MLWTHASSAAGGGRHSWRAAGIGAVFLLCTVNLTMKASGQDVLWTLPNLSGNGGVTMAPLGDVNGDGIPDLVVGDPGYTPIQQNQGQAIVVSGVDGSQIHRVWGLVAFDDFGASVSGGGDINNDGVPDFLVGAPGDDRFGLESGVVYAYSGLDGALIHAVGDVSLRRAGQVWDLGDVNDDHHSDFGVIANDGFSPLRVYSGLDASLLWELKSPIMGAFTSAARIGDVDGDGHADIAAANFAEPVIFVDEGIVVVFSGRTGEQRYAVGGSLAFDHFGHSMASIEDLSGDGVGELLIGAPQPEPLVLGPGYALIVDGRLGTVRQRIDGEMNGDLFGWNVSAVGDINGDGDRDHFISAPGWSRPLKDIFGRGILYSGLSTAALRRYDRTVSFASGLGDIDLDGNDDWAVVDAGFLPEPDVSVLAGETLHTVSLPETVTQPTPVSIVTTRGAPGQVVLLFLTEVNEVPTLQLMDYGTFGATGHHNISGFAPAIRGLSLTFQAVTREASGEVLVSSGTRLFLD